jgi:hypothetical protein
VYKLPKLTLDIYNRKIIRIKSLSLSLLAWSHIPLFNKEEHFPNISTGLWVCLSPLSLYLFTLPPSPFFWESIKPEGGKQHGKSSVDNNSHFTERGSGPITCQPTAPCKKQKRTPHSHTNSASYQCSTLMHSHLSKNWSG